MKPYLALFRSGPSSLHPHAVERLASQNFDYALSYFGDDEPVAPGAVFVHRQKGAKWPGLQATLAAYSDVIQQYRYVWFPDDDLLTTPENVSRMFLLCDELGIDLAQPALTPDSPHTHLITLQHKDFQVRFTNFVEIMAPVLSAEMLVKVFPTLHGCISGFGLDHVWPRLTTLGRVAILDATPVQHTRPVGGPNYRFNREAGLAPADEARVALARYAIETPAQFQINYAGVLQSGECICMGATADEANRLIGEVLSSTRDLKVNALTLTQYLSSHLAYWQGGSEYAGRSSYSRSLLRPLLNSALAKSGIVFRAPGETARAVPAPAASPAPTAARTPAAALAH